MTDAPARLQALGVEDRVTIQAGSAFEAVPPGADAYILSHVIHDWNEDQLPHHPAQLSRRDDPDEPIAHHRAGAARGQCPRLWQRRHGDDDVNRRRGANPREFESLLARAGLTMTRVVPTTTSASIVEAS